MCIIFYKSLLNRLQYCFCFVVCFFGHEACGVLAPWLGIEPTPPALEGEVFNCWAAREGPLVFITNTALAKLLIFQHVWLQLNPLYVLVKYMLTSFLCPPPSSLLPTYNCLPPLSPEESTLTSRLPHRSLHSAVMPRGSQLPPYPI